MQPHASTATSPAIQDSQSRAAAVAAPGGSAAVNVHVMAADESVLVL